MSSGADIEAKNLQQDTPLMTACKQENVQAAAALLQAGRWQSGKMDREGQRHPLCLRKTKNLQQD